MAPGACAPRLLSFGRCDVPQDVVPPGARAVRNCLGGVFLGPRDCQREGTAQSQVRDDCGRVRAAGAVRVHAADKRRRQQQFGPAIVEDVHGLPAVGQVAAFDQDSAAVL